MFVRISSEDDARLAPYRLVADPDALRRAGLFVAEGRLVLPSLLSSAYRVQSVLISEAALEPVTPALTARPDLQVLVAPAALISAVGGHNFHRGCLALGHRSADPAFAPPPAESGKTVVLLEGVSNPDNVGGIFRAARAFDAGAIGLGPGCGDPLYRKAIRTSMGASLHVNWGLCRDWLEDLRRVREAGYAVIALTPRADAMPLDDAVAASRAPAAFVLGSEGYGLSDAAMEVAGITARIPIARTVDSLNVVTAAAIALYEARRSAR